MSDSEQWNKVIHSGNKYWIIREGHSSDYIIMAKPAHLFDNGHPVDHYHAMSNEEAISRGVELAQRHGLK
ncbi:hypothetical protein [Desulfoscipio gibsoniae]|uniref:hypothetical protein n=1 Tax=Desulfoscipio gibsoniae TaxID=102134 RepID=UPI00030143B8|nr:hypothetical protein [Desulfoscipio gibsoniae]